MMSNMLMIGLAACCLYVLFHLWYGGRGKPMTADEVEHYMRILDSLAADKESRQLLGSLRALALADDGEGFVMQNLVRYRAKALYPPGYDFDDDPRAADRRYGRAIIPHLLRFGSMPVFVARRSGNFIEPEGADAWHYVAMVRYRSRRDFLRFAVSIARKGIDMHKWAAIEKTHVFLVKPLLSLIFVRGLVAVLLALVVLAVALL